MVVYSAQTQQCGGFHGAIGNFSARSAKRHRAGYIQHQKYSQLPFFNVFFDVRSIEPGADVPVDISYIVIEGVFAHFVELDTAAFENAVVCSADNIIDQFAGDEFQFADFFQQFGCFDHLQTSAFTVF